MLAKWLRPVDVVGSCLHDGAAVDTAMVGAGLIGLATAHALCRDGRGAWRCSTAGCRAAATRGVRSRWCAATTPMPSPRSLAMAGTRTIVDWADQVGVADAGYVGCGYLLTVPERLEAACRGNVERLQRLGLETRFLNVDEIPARRAASCRCRGSPARPTSPRADLPTRRRCAWAGSPPPRPRPRAARLGNGVNAIRVEGGRVTGVETDQGFVAGGHGRARHRRVGERPAAPPGTPVSRSSCGGCKLRWPARQPGAAAALGRVLRCRHERGGATRSRPPFCAVAYAGEDVLERADDCDHAALGGVCRRRASRAGRALSASLGEFELLRGFAGPVRRDAGLEPDHRPVPGDGRPVPGVGWSGHGFKLSPAVGEVVAAEVTGRTPPIDVSELRPERFAQGRLLRLAYGPGARA